MGRSTLDIEREHGLCAKCSSTLYLDAAIGECRCPSCEMHGARELQPGRYDLDEKGSVIEWVDSWLEDTKTMLRVLMGEVEWGVFKDVINGTTLVQQPREIAYQATGAALEVAYSYEGLSTPLEPKPFSRTVQNLRRLVEVKVFGEDDGFFNSAHLNLYRAGRDHVSWHTDEDEVLYGDRPVIASLSFGCRRTFGLRSRDDADTLASLSLGDGALLVMSGATQTFFEHSVRKQDEVGDEPRVNITFRRVLATHIPSSVDSCAINGSASIFTGAAGSQYPLTRDMLLTTTFFTLLPVEIFTLGSLSRAVQSFGYIPGTCNYEFHPSTAGFDELCKIRVLRSGRNDIGAGLAAWFAPRFRPSFVPELFNRVACVALFTARHEKPRFCIVLCGGNAFDLSYRIPQLHRMAALFPDADVVTFDYGGFGLSDGVKPCEKNTYADVAACCNSYGRMRGARVPMLLYGHSLGASVAIDFATSNPGRTLALCLDGAPASIFNCLSCGSPLSIASVFGFLDHYPNVQKIAKLDCPVYMVHGLLDPICPPINAMRLRDAAPSGSTRHEPIFFVPGASHGDCDAAAPTEYRRRLRRFVHSVLGPSSFS